MFSISRRSSTTRSISTAWNRPTEYLPDRSRTIVSENKSPDVGFRYSINPYRGCSHGCSYCYARPTHEYLGLNAGLDFETKIFVKEDAPRLVPGVPLARELACRADRHVGSHRLLPARRADVPADPAAASKSPPSSGSRSASSPRTPWSCATSTSSRDGRAEPGPCEREPDDARRRAGPVDGARTSTPAARLRAIKALPMRGSRCGCWWLPVIPGLNDTEIPAILAAAREAGAQHAAFTMLRLPLTVAPVFQEWLEREQPGRAQKIESRDPGDAGWEAEQSEFGDRMRGSARWPIRSPGCSGSSPGSTGWTGLAPLRLHAISSPEAGDGAVVAILILGN